MTDSTAVPSNGSGRRREGEPEAQAAHPGRHTVEDVELALRLPAWDLVPPTEFVRRPTPR
jgi:hypothetical protein